MRPNASTGRRSATTPKVEAENETTEQSIEEVDTGPGGHCGATHQSSAADLPPHIDTSDKPLPGPAHPTLQRTKRPRKTSTRKPFKTAG
jgi:hypothetical protein